jgi:hypothetical protein
LGNFGRKLSQISNIKGLEKAPITQYCLDTTDGHERYGIE